MHKIFINALSNYEFEYDRFNAYGKVEGYEVNLNVQSYPTLYFSTFLTQAKKNEFVMKLNALKLSFVHVTPFDYGVAVKVSALFGKEYTKRIPMIIETVVSILNEIEAPKCDICPQSGEKLDEVENKVITLPELGIKLRLTSAAIETVNSTISKANEDFKAAPNRYGRGFLGILIGAIAGVILTIVFSYIGFITTIAPLVAILLGTFLYQKFGGKPNSVMIVMSFVTTTVIILGVLFAIYYLGATGWCLEQGVNLSGNEAFKYCMANDEEFAKGFRTDMLFNLLFIFIAEGLSVAGLIRKIRRPNIVQ